MEFSYQVSVHDPSCSSIFLSRLMELRTTWPVAAISSVGFCAFQPQDNNNWTPFEWAAYSHGHWSFMTPESPTGSYYFGDTTPNWSTRDQPFLASYWTCDCIHPHSSLTASGTPFRLDKVINLSCWVEVNNSIFYRVLHALKRPHVVGGS